MQHGAAIVSAAAWLSLVSLPSTKGSDASPLDDLADSGSITCKPAIKHFCRNIHAGCSGRSDIKAGPFVLSVTGETADLDFKTASPPESPTAGFVQAADDKSYVLVRLRPDADYIRIEADGRYSFRLYRRGTAYMSRGTCR